jgi:four helix bundle protein
VRIDVSTQKVIVDKVAFQARTKQIGLRVVRMVEALPPSQAAGVIGRQVLRSATSVGANYRAACRAQSPRDLIRKLKIVEEEADETLYWLELLIESGIVERVRLAGLIDETNQVLAMTVASLKTLRKNHIYKPRRPS